MENLDTFLYHGVMTFQGKIIPIVQMLSEEHDANFISYWLKEWLRSEVPVPIETVTDIWRY